MVVLTHFLSLYVVLLSLLSIHSHANEKAESTYAQIQGNVMLGGLVAVHDAGGQNDVHCDSNISSYGIQRVEAMRYAVSKVKVTINLCNNLNWKNCIKLLMCYKGE